MPQILNQCPALWGAALLLLGLSLPAQAHNGAVAIAVPVEGIAVEGDLSDWPEGMKRYPIALAETGDRPKDKQDYQGSFRIGYSERENALYLAVEVEDESVVLEAPAPDWNTQDGIEVYVAVPHEQKGGIGQYRVRGNIPGVFEGVSLADFSAAMRRGAHFHDYEVRLNIQEKTRGQVRLHPGMILGFDVVVCDKDVDGSFSWMAWGPRVVKFVSSERVGDLALVTGEALEARQRERGRLSGQVRWEGSQEGVAHARVQVRSLAGPGRGWVQIVEADGKGEWALAVPPGKYQVALRWPGRGALEQQGASVSLGSEVQLGLQAPAPQGMRVQAGPGKGHWEHFGVVDGLGAPAVWALLQDRSGRLWFGTRGGLSQYEGQSFVTFTPRDGLAHRQVRVLLEDRSGCLWVGTEDGLSRYDGHTFTTFTTQDGLADNGVDVLFEDRQGQVWVGTQKGASRYDGHTFTTFTTQDGLAGNRVFAITEDQQGQVWVGTQKGVSRYDGHCPHHCARPGRQCGDRRL